MNEALKIRERATTIPKGSTLQVNNGGGSAGHPIQDDDIVSSAWQHAAAERRVEFDGLN
jgi:hypothetical protein